MNADHNNDRPGQALAASNSAFAAVALFSFLGNALLLTLPLYMLQVYDRVLTSGSRETLVMLTIMALGLLVTAGLLDVARSRILVRIGVALDSGLNARVFRMVHTLRLRGDNAAREQPIRDLDTIRAFISGNSLTAFFDTPWTPAFLLVIFLMHPVLGLVASAGALMLVAMAVVGEVTTRHSFRASSRERLAAFGFAEGSVKNADAARAMGMLPALTHRWLERHEAAMASQACGRDRASAVTAAAKVLRQGLQIAMLGTGAYLVLEQAVNPGVMIAASIILGRALAPLEASIRSWRGFADARLAWVRLRQALAHADGEDEQMELPEPCGRLEVEAVSAAPPTVKKPVLERLTFSLEPGEVLGVIGTSAAGKSTLARILVGVWRPLIGKVRLDGAELGPWVGQHIGYLPQDVQLFDGSVAENIARFGTQDPGRIVAAAKRAGVHEMILRLPQGYDTAIGDEGRALSGGQRQRIALARALYGDPALVVLDEPNANLDNEGEEALRHALAELRDRGTAVVIISHRLNVLSAADRIMVLRNGAIEHLGPRAEVFAALTRAVDAAPDVRTTQVAAIAAAG